MSKTNLTILNNFKNLLITAFLYNVLVPSKALVMQHF